MKYKVTLSIVATCLVLQALQTRYPGMVEYQAIIPELITGLRKIPLLCLQVVAHMFSHGSWDHLLGNMSVGIPLLAYLEHKVGGKETLRLYLITGVIAAFTQFAMPMGGGGLIGSSGSIFGLFGAACMLFGDTPVKQLIAAMVLALRLLPQIMVLSLGPLMPDGVAHAAHIGGCVAGMALVAMTGNKKDKISNNNPKSSSKNKAK